MHNYRNFKCSGVLLCFVFLVFNGLNTSALAAVEQNANTVAPKANVDSSSGQQIMIDVGQAAARKIRLAIPNFEIAADAKEKSPLAEQAVSLQKRLVDIFNFTAGFEFIPSTGFIAKEPTAKTLNYDDWSAIKAEALILGKIEQGSKKGTKSLQLRLYDIKQRKQLIGKAYANTADAKVDMVLRRFADLCMQALTGELGIFSTKLAFVAARAPGEPKQLYLSNFDGSDLQQVTNNKSINMSPSWSPDGTKVTFTSFKDGKAEIYSYSLINGKISRLTQSSGNNSGANWHPDGKIMVFSGSSDGKTAIYKMNSLDGSKRSLFISGSGLEVEPAFSPDGNSIAFASGRFGNPHIFIRDLNSSKDVRITFAGWYNSSPSWRPDGKKLAFAGYDREIDRYDVFIVNPDGRQLERLTLDQGDNEKPSWSPDGKFISFQSNRADSGKKKQSAYRIFVMNKDGGEQRPLSIPLYDVNMPSWSPRLGFLD